MGDLVFMEIAHEIKGLHNGALERIRNRQYGEAREFYRKCLQITEIISYHEGSAFTLFSLANLGSLDENYPQAITDAVMAKDRFEKAGLSTNHCDTLLSNLAVAAKKKGIELERSKRFKEAIDHFESAVPYADEESSKAMQHEVLLLRRIITEKNI